jgi:hypothetical protein
MTDNQGNQPRRPDTGAEPDPAEPQAGKPRAHGSAAREGARQMRRHWLKAGLAAVPIVLTLRARPARADVRLASPGHDPDFFVTGHGLSHADEVHDGSSETDGQSADWVGGGEGDSGWSDGPSWDTGG